MSIKNCKTYLKTLPLLMGIIVSSCTATGDKSLSSDKPALPTMENIALNARQCWFRSQDKGFLNYKLAPELKSYSDRPRILVVPRSNPNARPLLVIEASGTPAVIQLYGPLMQTKLSKQINENVENWSKGQQHC